MSSAPRRRSLLGRPGTGQHTRPGGAGANSPAIPDPAEPTPDPIDGFDALEVVEHHRSRHTFDNDAAQDSFAMEDPPSEEVRLDPRFASAAEPATEVIERDALEAMRNEVTIGSPVSLPPSVFRYDALPAVSAEVSHEPTGFVPLPRAPRVGDGPDDPALPTQKISRDLLAAIAPPVSESTLPTLLPDASFERRAPSPVDDGALDELSLDDPVGTEPEPVSRTFVAHGARPDAETTVLPDAADPEAPQPLPPSELWTGPSSVAALAGAAPATPAPAAPAPQPQAHPSATPSPAPSPQAERAPHPAATPAGATGRSRVVAAPAAAGEESGPNMGPVVGVIALIGSGGVLAAAAAFALVVVALLAYLLWPAGDDASTLPPIDLPAATEPAPATADGTPPPEAAVDEATDPEAAPGADDADHTDGAPTAGPTRRRQAAPAPVEPPPEPEPVVAPVEEVIDIEPVPEPVPEPERKGGLFKKRR